MASGWGITGNKGRCYDFWIDFSECMSRCREPKDCSLLREDYLECLHHSKEQILFLFRISEKTLKRSFLSFYHLCTVLIMSYHCWERYHLVPDLSFEDDILFPYSLGFSLYAPQISWRFLFVYVANIAYFFFLKYQRRNRIYKEEQRQLRAAAQKANEGGHDGGSHH
ncbi:hypothetical protein M9H77_33191 [Catharanthus roseus]|uniref:Uncharacterized protein n=1 Tax=Catharanthus roseus TaxID=4058 RepID=A0ACB9ZK49_CATRO|nr:hypothetical protein M9H77_33191 [Catharanthus roseus]